VASKESRNLSIAVGALVAFAATMVWVMAAPSESPSEVEADEEEVAEAPVQPEPVKSAPPSKPTPAAKPAAQPPSEGHFDLFAGEMPDFMANAHARVLEKKWLDVSVQKQLYQWGQEHKDDARPQLLLAWDSMHRDWEGIAVRMYRIAYRADHRAKQDPSMLRDLLSIVSRYDRTEFREGAAILHEAFGEEALPAIDKELEALRTSGDVTRSARLQRLRDMLTGKTPVPESPVPPP
jgi:hypothetical protein